MAIAFTFILILTQQDFSSALTALYSPINIFCIIVLSVGVESCNMALNLMPVSAFFLAIYMLGEPITIYKLISVVVVLFSLTIFVKYKKTS